MTQLVKVHLHGRLGEELGNEWELFVKTPAEALRLIEANTKKCIKFLSDAKERNVGYSIIVGGQPIWSEEELNGTIGDKPEIHFIPLAEGAKSGLGKIIIGIVLLAAVFVFQQWYLAPAIKAAGGAALLSTGWTAAAYVAQGVMMAGVGLVAGGITQLLVGNPNSPAINSEENQPSYIFNGPLNTTRQGNPVPICYGKMLCGSSLVSLEVNSTDISTPYVETQVTTDPDDPYSSGGTVHSPSQVESNTYIVESPFRKLNKPTELP